MMDNYNSYYGNYTILCFYSFVEKFFYTHDMIIAFFPHSKSVTTEIIKA